jgi:hypothetical protein
VTGNQSSLATTVGSVVGTGAARVNNSSSSSSSSSSTSSSSQSGRVNSSAVSHTNLDIDSLDIDVNQSHYRVALLESIKNKNCGIAAFEDKLKKKGVPAEALTSVSTLLKCLNEAAQTTYDIQDRGILADHYSMYVR